jgi:hypothetical protein
LRLAVGCEGRGFEFRHEMVSFKLENLMGNFLNGRALSSLRFAMEVFNSRLKRGEIPKHEEIVRLHQVYCGCGDDRCCFISVQRKESDDK